MSVEEFMRESEISQIVSISFFDEGVTITLSNKKIFRLSNKEFDDLVSRNGGV